MFFEHPELFFSFLSAISSLFLSILLLLKFHSRGGICFAGLSLSMALWQGGKLAKNLTLVFPVELSISLWSDISFIGATFIYSTFFRMACRISFRDKGFFQFLSLLGFVSSFFFVILELKGILSTGERETAYGYYREPSVFYSIYLVNYFFFMGLGIFLFYPGFYRKVLQLRKQAVAIFYGAIFGFGLGSFEFIGIYTNPVFPVADLSPFVFGSVLYWAIYRFNIIRGGELLKRNLVRLLYLAFLFFLTLVIYLLSAWVVKTLNFPSGNFFLISVFALFLFFLTPVYLKIQRSIRHRFFPVRFSYSKLSATLSRNLSGLDTMEKMFKSVMDRMEKEFGYHRGCAVLFDYRNDRFNKTKFKVIGRPLSQKVKQGFFQNREYSKIISRRQILEQLRFGQIRDREKHNAMMDLRHLNRLETDLLLPVFTQHHIMGLLLFSQKSFHPEPWEEVSDLLTSLVELLGNQAYQVLLLNAKSEQEHLSRAGMMAASMAHEIKNPLEGIYGAAQILRERDAEDERFIKMILKDTERLNEVVQRFLQFSKFFVPEPVQFELISFVKDFITRQNTLDELHKLELECNTGDLEVLLDKDGLTQVLLNLVQNAKRYQVAGKDVKLRVKKMDGTVSISVEDEGPGIKNEDKERLFDPFFTTSVKGTGLGLAISRKIAKGMGGDLYYEPMSPGSRFVLVLPL
jgi:signal transduction histidine kinase